MATCDLNWKHLISSVVVVVVVCRLSGSYEVLGAFPHEATEDIGSGCDVALPTYLTEVGTEGVWASPYM